MHYEGEGGASVQRKNLNRVVRYEAEVEQSENTHSLSLHTIQSRKEGRKPQNVPLTKRRCTLLCEKDVCAMKLTRNRNVKDRERQRGSTCFKCTFCRQNLTLNSSHFLQIVKSDNWSGATRGNRLRDQNWLPQGPEGGEREGGWGWV